MVLLLSGFAAAADAGPLPAKTPLPADGQMRISPSDRCPVCAMFPSRHPRAAAAMSLKSGQTFYFCSNGCLLRAWLRSLEYISRPRQAIDRMVVLDYFSGRSLDAQIATWVAGSNVIGPMGPALVALRDPDELTAFRKRHGGKTVFSFDQLDDTLWKQISRYELPLRSSE